MGNMLKILLLHLGSLVCAKLKRSDGRTVKAVDSRSRDRKLNMYVCKGFGRIYTEQLRSGIHKVVPT